MSKVLTDLGIKTYTQLIQPDNRTAIIAKLQENLLDLGYTKAQAEVLYVATRKAFRDVLKL